jgi:glutamate 5-kinase
MGGLWGWIFGLLMFVVGMLLVARTWAVVDTKFAVDAAARQAVRTYVEAPDATAAGAEADQAADTALAGYGRHPSQAGVALVSGTFSRCSLVTIKVTYPSPLLELPWLGSVGRHGEVTATHSELVDPFRTGLPGTSSCA